MEAVKIITLPPSENPASAAPLSTSAASLGRPKTQSEALVEADNEDLINVSLLQ